MKEVDADDRTTDLSGQEYFEGRIIPGSVDEVVRLTRFLQIKVLRPPFVNILYGGRLSCEDNSEVGCFRLSLHPHND